MPLEFSGDEPVAGAHEMQHLDDRTVRRHCAPGRKRDGEHRGHKDEHEHHKSDSHCGTGHRAHSVDPAAVVIEGGVGNLGGERLP